MHLIIAGCEYSGSTTHATEFGRWAHERCGESGFGPNQYHDHWKLPHINNFSPPGVEDIAELVTDYPDSKCGDYTRTGLTAEEQVQVMALSPKLKEMVQRYHLQYHLHPSFYAQPDHIMVGAHLDEGILGPLYFGYGGNGMKGDRRKFVRGYEEQILELAPDTILVLVTATAEVIRERMLENPHTNGAVKEDDIDTVLRLYTEAYEGSLLRHKITVDTSRSSVEQSVSELVERLKPLLSDTDRRRLGV